MNKKAFTLVELLAVIVILGILIAIAIPQVTKYIESSKKSAYADSIISFGKQVEMANPKDFTKTSGVSIYSFEDIEIDKGDTTKSPYGTFDQNKSFVIIHCTEKKCTSYVQAVDSKNKGIKLTDLDAITKKDIVDINTSDMIFSKTQQDVINGYLNKVGDVNRDGYISISDVTAIQYHIAGTSPLSERNLTYADVNLDGKVDNHDATLIQKYNIKIVDILPIKYGDVNDDGIINIKDVTEIRKHTGGIATLTGHNLEAADVNLDGLINDTDAEILQEYIN